MAELLSSTDLKFLPARGTRLNKKKRKHKFIHENSNSKECTTRFECREVKCGANHGKFWAKSTKYASCTSSQ